MLLRARRNLKVALEESGSRVHGVVAPALVGFRMRWRTTIARLRDLAQAPVISVGVDGMASAMIATGLVIASVTASTPASGGDMAPEFQFTAASVAQEDLREAAVAVPPHALSDEIGVTASAATAVDQGAEKADPETTEIVMPESGTPLKTEGEMVVHEGEDEFSIRHDIVVRVGDHDVVLSQGNIVSVGCASIIGEVVCSVDDYLTP